MDHLISLYIDDEMTLDEKIAFVEGVSGDAELADLAVSLLVQEKMLRMSPAESAGAVTASADIIPFGRGRRFRRARRFLLGAAAAGAMAAAIALAFVRLPAWTPGNPAAYDRHRFVIYQPEARQVAIAGTFTGWRPVSLKPLADSGYWEVEMPIPAGEHRFSYILEDGRRLPDPTVLTRELDDFGGRNSVIVVDA